MTNIIPILQKQELRMKSNDLLQITLLSKWQTPNSILRTLSHGWWECKLMQPPWKTVWGFLKKLQTELRYDSAIVLLGTYLKNTKMLVQRDACTPMFMAALSTVAKLWKQLKCPLTDEWIKKMWCGDAWVAQQLSVCLSLRVWSWSPRMESHIRIPAWSLLLPLPMSLPFSLCLSWINK